MAQSRILLVGLGNVPLPNTRHNVGMMVLDAIAKSLNLTWSQNRSWKSDMAETNIQVQSKNEFHEYKLTLLKPRKLMNISGSCIAQAVKDLSLPLRNVYVFHDDMQRGLGKVNFNRVRIGIGRPPADIDNRSNDVVAQFVLSKFTQAEIATLEETVYPMWTQNNGLELLCHQGQLFKLPKVKNKKKKAALSTSDIEDNTIQQAA
ncbi:peptidyl-tRNA hydrolase [Gilbertella persicaria]|uniref:peptidyl-tRNA hydrolase n=1 Tax=Gilbertella persicaria TaxID=101096 RepID=UPI00221FBE69|nr:peptidyl-tRNA hydrolase [Gilbertella persicaria]KAI8086928.1 peptidyl-tRNA hydrolase [Gilbertella persicaria]